jgi:hypothetical protein
MGLCYTNRTMTNTLLIGVAAAFMVAALVSCLGNPFAWNEYDATHASETNGQDNPLPLFLAIISFVLFYAAAGI